MYCIIFYFVLIQQPFHLYLLYILSSHAHYNIVLVHRLILLVLLYNTEPLNRQVGIR